MPAGITAGSKRIRRKFLQVLRKLHRWMQLFLLSSGGIQRSGKEVLTLKLASKRGLTAKKRLFCRFYYDLQNGAEAAIRAGYPAGEASKVAAELLSHPAVVEELHLMIMRDCEQMLPAHLEILFDLGALSWDGFDRQDLTFDARDACDLSWDQFEAQDEIE